MFCHPAARRIMIVLTALLFVVLSVVEIFAQNFDDDPLMLDGGDEFGFEQFGNDDFHIDKKQNEILDHLHWHARPNGWKPRKLRWRIKNKIRDFYRKCTNTKQN